MRRVSLLILALIFSVISNAQDINFDDLSQLIPTDKNIRIGKLSNGLKYYIKYNQRPEDKVELRLVVNAGSLLEDDDQLGLAHFTEHMAFNGSEHFEKNELLDYVQSVGVKFGAHINAYTSFDETVYMLPIASDSAEILENAFLILEDWATGLSFDHEEIDKERGVVIEEWRLGQGAQRRMLDQWLPVLFKGSRYADRLPIGTKEILENFDYDVIKRYYNDWYRPDLMAVVVVGDIDVDEMEQKIKDHFAGLENPKKPRQKPFYEVPDHDNTEVVIVSDPEAPFTNAMVINKYDPEEVATLGDYRNSLMYAIYTGMLNQRLDELRQQADPPFIYAATGAGGSFVRNKHAYQSFSAVKESEIERGLIALLTENQRVSLHGFTEGELVRYKKDMLRNYEVAYNERDKSESKGYANEYTNNFLEGEPIPGITFEYEFVKKHLDGITLEEINKLSSKWQTDKNRVVVITGPEKEGVEYPSKDRVLEILEEVKNSEIEPYVEEEIAETLISELPEPGKIKLTQKIEEVGVTKLSLSNGIKVFLKPTDFKNDEIVMSSYSLGGHSLTSDEDYRSAEFATSIIAQSGVGDFSQIDLSKALAGKSVNVTPFITELSEGVGGSSTPQDLETMFQLIHLYFTAPRKDKEAFASVINRNKAILKNINADPQYYFQDQMSRFLSQNHLRGGGIPTVEDLNDIDHDKIMNVYKERFADASDFNFFFVGNFDINEIKNLCERYLANLPATKRKETWKDVGVRPPFTKEDKEFKKGNDPKSQVVMRFTREVEYNLEDAFLVNRLGQLLDIKLVENLREDKSGVYGVSAGAGMAQWPYEYFNMQVRFPCAPENVEKLTAAVLEEIKKIQTDGPKDEDLQKIREQNRREFDEQLKKNGWWARVLESYIKYDRDFNQLLDVDKRIEKVTVENIQKMANKYLDTEVYIRLVLNPENVD